MAIRKIAVMGNPILRVPAAPIPEAEITSPKIQTLITDMIETMFEYDGVGLAAPQIHESLQLVVMLWNFEPDKEPAIRVLINPVIAPLTKDTSGFWEGCLSVPGIRGLVERPTKISVQALNQKKEKISLTVEGFGATVIQHECDHLIGKLYVDRITDHSKLAFMKEYKKFHLEEGEMYREDD